jgi:hypothetical protein
MVTPHRHLGFFREGTTRLLVYECSLCGARRVWGSNAIDTKGVGAQVDRINDWRWSSPAG